MYTRMVSLLFVALMFVVVELPAQTSETEGTTPRIHGFEMSSITISHGKGVLSSGLAGYIAFERGSETIELSADAGQGWFAYDRKIGSRVNIAGSFGLLDNTPWFGPRISVKPIDSVTLMVWPGWSVGEKFGEPGFTTNFGIKSGFLFVDVGPFTGSFVVLKFEDNDVQHIPGLAFSQVVNRTFKVLVGGDYDLTNDEPLFRIELRITP